jgi:hypothetical protein
MKFSRITPEGVRRGLTAVVLVIALPLFVWAQDDPNVNLTFDVQLIDVDVFYLSDAAFNIQNVLTSPAGPVLLTMTITSDRVVNIAIGIRIVAETNIAPGPIEIFEGITRPISLEANRPRFFTNRDFGKGGSLELIAHDLIDLTDPTPETQRVVDVLRRTGKLPDGTYEFYLTAYVPASVAPPYGPFEELTSIQRQLRIINPTRVDLLSPFDGERVVTRFPLFQWRSDTRRVNLKVFEIPQGARSREEAITGIPHLEMPVSDINQFFYPQSGAGVRALEPGKSYVWFVEGLYRTSANVEEGILSELFEFTIVDPAEFSSSDYFRMQLERLFGSEYADILRRLEQEGFEFTGDIFLDGAPINTAEFSLIVEAIRTEANNARLINVSIEE